MEDIVAASPGIPARRILTATFTAFALLAVVLGALGLFGAAAHDVASRRVELAVRIALGADPSRILISTIAQGAAIVGFGLAAGGLMSIWMAQMLGALLAGTGGIDLLSAGVPAAIMIVAGLAAVLPAALRAARMDPLSGLRAE
jgi:putative ABC transport system permease protein